MNDLNKIHGAISNVMSGGSCSNYGKFFKCVQYVTGKQIHNMMIIIYQHELLNTNGGKMTLEKFCKRKRIKIKKFGHHVNKYKDIDLTSIDSSSEPLDLSLSCIIIIDICSNIFNMFDAQCQQNIKELKFVRNRLCHDECLEDLTHEQLSVKVTELENLILQICKGIQKKLEIDLSMSIEQFKKELKNVTESKLTDDDQKKFMSFLQTKISQIILGGREELGKYYNKFKVLSPCDWLEPNSYNKYNVNKVYTPLIMKEDYKEVFVELQNLLIVKNGSDCRSKIPNVLMLHGLAGCGKTTLCCKILSVWAKLIHSNDNKINKEIEGLHTYDLVIFVEVRMSETSTFSEYVQKYLMPETLLNYSPENMDSYLQMLSMLIIIDGYDETTKIGRDLVSDIFRKFNANKIILTSRPGFCVEPKEIVHNENITCLTIEVQGFDDDRLKLFSEKMFNSFHSNQKMVEKQHKAFMDYLFNEGRVLKDHLKLPLTATLLIILWTDKRTGPEVVKNIYTATKLYFEIFKLLQERFLDKSKDYDEDDAKCMYRTLCSQAFKQLDNEDFYIKDEHLDQIKLKCKGMESSQFLSVFLRIKEHPNESRNKFHHSFIHKTQVEYMAATHIVDEYEEMHNKHEFITFIMKFANNHSNQYKGMLYYIIGHLHMRESLNGELCKVLLSLALNTSVQKTDYLYWWKILLEGAISQSHLSRNNTVLYNVLLSSNLTSIIENDHWKLNYRTVVAGLNLLKFTTVRLPELIIEIEDSCDPNRIYEFFDTMVSMKNILKARRCKPIKTELHLVHHESQGFENSDRYLRTLHPWAHLSKFTGHIGTEANYVLQKCTNVKMLRVRISDEKVLQLFRECTQNVFKKIDQIYITLDIAKQLDPKTLKPFISTGKLVLILKDISDNDVHWASDIVKNAGPSGGWWKVELNHSQICCEAVLELIDLVRYSIRSKLTIESYCDIDEKEQTALDKRSRPDFTVDWIS